MINFNKNSVFNLKPIEISEVRNEVASFLIEGEEILNAFQTFRDQVVFTNKRIISIDVQGITGQRKSFSTLPYSTIQFFEIQTKGFNKAINIDIGGAISNANDSVCFRARHFGSCSPRRTWKYVTSMKDTGTATACAAMWLYGINFMTGSTS